ncbi:MAG: hypothetical protein KF816_06385 [Melioribacteraceae bacterium]|nr:hypothetical protein [Melioribacteraceae bacterium]
MIDRELQDEQQARMFENEYQLTGKYDKESSERIKAFYNSIGKPIPTLKDLYNANNSLVYNKRSNVLNNSFINCLMENILEGTKIPKVQVEREVGFILGIFIEELLCEKLKMNDEYSGNYQLISREFPLKKDNNNQSTNIDFLLLNKEKGILIFLELKTDSSSNNNEQLQIYLDYKKRINEATAALLLNDLLVIKNNSSKPKKYDYIMTKIEKFSSALAHINKTLVIYLVPGEPKNGIKKPKSNEIDLLWSFSDLPIDINHQYSDEWKIIQKYLTELDKN